jgi:predicted nucleic acid-binding protein
MGPGARAAFAAAEAGRASMLVPAIVMAEVLYLSEKGRIEATLRDVDSYMKTHRDIEERPLDLAVVKSAAGITDVGELCS